MASYWNGRQSRVGSPAPKHVASESSESSESTDSLAPVTAMMSSIAAQGSYSLPKQRSEVYSDHDGNPFTPRAKSPEVSQAMDSAVDDNYTSSNDETPLEIAQLQFRDRQSFNSGIRDLVQEIPDTPIGGLAMKRSFNARNRGKGAMDAPQDGSQTSYFPDSADHEQKRPLMNRSNFSDPVYAVSMRGARSPLTRSDTSLPFLTAQASPARGKRMYNHSNLSYDGSADEGPSSTTQAHDFAQISGPHDLADCATDPVADAPKALGSAGAPVIVPVELVIDPNSGTGFITAPMSANLAGALVDTLGAAPLPVDVTGQLPTPTIPKSKGSKRKKALKKGQKLVRKSRAKLIRRPVLVIILGRQLGKPTAFALKQISKGVQLDDIAADAVTVPGVPIPVPVSVPE